MAHVFPGLRLGNFGAWGTWGCRMASMEGLLPFGSQQLRSSAGALSGQVDALWNLFSAAFASSRESGRPAALFWTDLPTLKPGRHDPRASQVAGSPIAHALLLDAFQGVRARARTGTLAINAPVLEQESVENVVVSLDDVVFGSGAACVWNFQRAFSVVSTRASHLGPTYKTALHRSSVSSAASALSARCTPATASTASWLLRTLVAWRPTMRSIIVAA